MTSQTSTKPQKFRAEVQKVLDLVVHSLYSNKEIFLRELISNASDALDKLRFESLRDGSLYEKDTELSIRVECNESAKTIAINDNGIGMSLDEIAEALGTIAGSGTRKFIESMAESQKKEESFIGQFGVGFYSVFMVADRVEVSSRRAGLGRGEGVKWCSEGNEEFTVETIDRPKRGTQVVLHIKESEHHLLNLDRLRQIVSTHCDNVSSPIIMPNKEGGDETVNNTKPLWARDKKEIKEHEYHDFYRNANYTTSAPLAHVHGKIEGTFEYTYLLFIPHQLTPMAWDRQQYPGLKLYVRRILILDNAKQLLPPYLRFVQGIVDSPDISLNVSREMLQQDRAIDVLRTGCAKKIISLLVDLAKQDAEKYTEFWAAFGNIVKEGLTDAPEHQENILKLLRFPSTATKRKEEQTSLEDYVGRMLPEQKVIYYIVADTYQAARNSPHLESLLEQKMEVLLLCEPIDAWIENRLTEFSGKRFQSVAKESEDAETDQKKEESSEASSALAEKIKNFLKDEVKTVRSTTRLKESPACLIYAKDSVGHNVAHMLKTSGHHIEQEKPVLEINPKHPLLHLLDREKESDKIALWSRLLYDQALLSEGRSLDDPGAFVKRLNSLIISLQKKLLKATVSR